jgi:arylsulfatase A-like enzyme
MASSTDRPNIVCVLADNVGWGDWSCYGGSTPTPRIDKLASDGVRLTNYCVESECTPTRSAIMTGRQSIRSGTYTVVPGAGPIGLTPWEYTIAELLSDAGYATAHFGKWHLGEIEGRLPTDQGFDEWWGYRNSADECGWTSYPNFREMAEKFHIYTPMIWEGKKGGEQTAVRPMNMAVRPFLEELITEQTTNYIKAHAKGDKPFFTYVCLSHAHMPEAVHPDFDRTDPSRLGQYADMTAEQDHRVGQIVDAVEQAGISDNTLIVFSSDNSIAGNPSIPYGGSSGPFRGTFFTPPYEGSYRTGAMVRWPGKVPAGVVSDEMFSAHDWYKTFASLAGASDKVPTDRPMDGVDASQFLLGQSQESGRESYMLFGGNGELLSVKYKNLKVIHMYSEGIDQPYVVPQLPMMFDLGSDPGETSNLTYYKLDNAFWFYAIIKLGIELKLSTVEYPNIKTGTGNDFDGYGGVKGFADREKEKIGERKVAAFPEPPMGPAPLSPAESRGNGAAPTPRPAQPRSA